MFTLASLLVLALPAVGTIQPAPSASLRVDDYADALAETNSILVTALDAHAKWCQKNKAYRERDLAYGRVLEHSPDHKLGRKMLGYTFDKKADEWVRKRKYREPKNSKAELAREARELLTAIDAEHLGRLMSFLNGKYGGSQRQHAELLKQLLEVNPDNEDLRQRNGQVRAEKQGETVWVLKESALALEKRRTQRELRKTLKADWQRPEDNEGPTTGDYDLDWPYAGSTDRVQVYGNASKSETMRALEVCHNLWDYTRDIFQHEMVPSLNIYMIEGSSRRNEILEEAYGDQPDRLARLKKVAGMRTGSSIFSYARHSAGRIDGACRQTLAGLLGSRFGINSRHGWVTEGFGMYLTDRLLHTRLTYFIRQTEYVNNNDKDRDRDMRRDDANWLSMAKRLLGGKSKPNIAIGLGRDVNNLSSKDLLVSFALAAFLMEGHPAEVTVKVLERVGKGDNSALVLEEVLGYDIHTLGERLHQWLTEIL
ncbi:MAG: hypothetical protein ACI8QC_002848 [Planctomycetota bacterium]|jgi:hypothetical protein